MILVSEAFSNEIRVEWNEKYQHANEGFTSVRWEAKVLTGAEEAHIVWYGPNCTQIKPNDKSSKYKITTERYGNGKIKTMLEIYNITQQDAGRYKLWSMTDKQQKWNYFTLTVGGMYF